MAYKTSKQYFSLLWGAIGFLIFFSFTDPWLYNILVQTKEQIQSLNCGSFFSLVIPELPAVWINDNFTQNLYSTMKIFNTVIFLITNSAYQSLYFTLAWFD